MFQLLKKVLNSTWEDLWEVCNHEIQWPSIPVWWQKRGHWSEMPNVVDAFDGTSHEIQSPPNEPQQQLCSGHRKYHCIYTQVKKYNSENE